MLSWEFTCHCERSEAIQIVDWLYKANIINFAGLINPTCITIYLCSNILI